MQTRLKRFAIFCAVLLAVCFFAFLFGPDWMRVAALLLFAVPLLLMSVLFRCPHCKQSLFQKGEGSEALDLTHCRHCKKLY